jgi:hypothetical protein
MPIAYYPTFLRYDLPGTTDFNFLHFSWHTLTIGPWPPGQMPTAGDGDEVVGSTAQLAADVRDDQVEIALRADDAGQNLARDRFFGAKITASTRPIHSGASAARSASTSLGHGRRPMASKSGEAEGGSARELARRADGDQTFKQPAAAAVRGARAGGRSLGVLGQQNLHPAGGVTPPQFWRGS